MYLCSRFKTVMIQEIRKPIEPYFEQYRMALENAMNSDIPALQHVTKHLKESSGKQIRPMLVLLSAALCGKVSEYSISSAVSLELLHTASLIHDDVVDDALERRSQASVKALWNNKIAILSGDFYLAKVLDIISSIPFPSIIKSVGSLGASLASGEIQQLSHSKDFSATEDVYYQIIKNKTASLFATCTYAGAISSGADDSLAEKLRLFGEYLGIAFQMKDDIFDYFENNTLGKPIGNDLSEGKLTLPLIHALSLDTADALHYRSLLSSAKTLSMQQVAEIYQFAKDNGGIEYAMEAANHYRELAIAQLDSFDDNEYKTSMIALLEYCINRNY